MIACHITLTLPLLAPPAPVRAQLFLIARALRFRRRASKRNAAWQDLEKAAVHDAVRDEKASLVAMFREDAIATSLANHLHFDDVANVSRTSRTMRGAVFHPSPEHGEQRFDMICESTCMGGAEKSECWACARLICDVSAPPLSSARDIHTSDNARTAKPGATGSPAPGPRNTSRTATPSAQSATSPSPARARPPSPRPGTRATCPSSTAGARAATRRRRRWRSRCTCVRPARGSAMRASCSCGRAGTRRICGWL